MIFRPKRLHIVLHTISFTPATPEIAFLQRISRQIDSVVTISQHTVTGLSGLSMLHGHSLFSSFHEHSHSTFFKIAQPGFSRVIMFSRQGQPVTRRPPPARLPPHSHVSCTVISSSDGRIRQLLLQLGRAQVRGKRCASSPLVGSSLSSQASSRHDIFSEWYRCFRDIFSSPPKPRLLRTKISALARKHAFRFSRHMSSLSPYFL